MLPFAISVIVVSAGLLFVTQGENGLPQTPQDGEEVAVIETGEGQIVLMFYPGKAPRHVENFKTLSRRGFYDGTRFHRTINGFMIQGGDPNSKDLSKAQIWGTGGNEIEGSEINLPAEFNDIRHDAGVLSMARSQDPDSASSQFFIMHKASPHLDGQYSAFGRVVKGQDVVDKIATKPSGSNGEIQPADAVVVTSVKIETWPLKG